jgi:hypothetical protein
MRFLFVSYDVRSLFGVFIFAGWCYRLLDRLHNNVNFRVPWQSSNYWRYTGSWEVGFNYCSSRQLLLTAYLHQHFVNCLTELYVCVFISVICSSIKITPLKDTEEAGSFPLKDVDEVDWVSLLSNEIDRKTQLLVPALNATHFKAYRCILLRKGVLLRSAKQNWLLNL